MGVFRLLIQGSTTGVMGYETHGIDRFVKES